jgi:hypothetical protein
MQQIQKKRKISFEITDFSVEIITYILFFLDIYSLVTCQLVCKSLGFIAKKILKKTCYLSQYPNSIFGGSKHTIKSLKLYNASNKPLELKQYDPNTEFFTLPDKTIGFIFWNRKFCCFFEGESYPLLALQKHTITDELFRSSVGLWVFDSTFISKTTPLYLYSSKEAFTISNNSKTIYFDFMRQDGFIEVTIQEFQDHLLFICGDIDIKQGVWIKKSIFSTIEIGTIYHFTEERSGIDYVEFYINTIGVDDCYCRTIFDFYENNITCVNFNSSYSTYDTYALVYDENQIMMVYRRGENRFETINKYFPQGYGIFDRGLELFTYEGDPYVRTSLKILPLQIYNLIIYLVLNFHFLLIFQL